MAIDEARQMGRAKNAVLSFFEERLSVPRIYIDADWAGEPVDVLAIDRDGVGDVHIALLFGRGNITTDGRAIDALLRRFAAVPAQFKYIVAVEGDPERGGAPLRLPDTLIDRSFAPDGIGRVGLGLVDFMLDGEPQTRLLIKPERFRARIAELADQYVQDHNADWEIRA